METLTPQDFLVFRSELGTASGFQSFQLREIELLLGLSNEERDKQGHSDPIDYLLKIVKETVCFYMNSISFSSCLSFCHLFSLPFFPSFCHLFSFSLVSDHLQLQNLE